MNIKQSFIYDSSLVLYLPLYKLDGASFMSRDAYGHLCTVTGALWTPRGRSFDGTDDYIDLGAGDAIGANLTDAIHIMAWAKSDDTVSDIAVVVGEMSGSRVGLGGGWTANKWKFYLHDGTWRNTGDSSVSVTTGWHFLEGTYDKNAGGNNLRLFVDTILEAENGTFTGSLTTDGNLAIGRTNPAPPSNMWHGLINEFWIWREVKTRLYSQHIYLATKWRYQ